MTTTPIFGWPVPDDTDRVSAGAANMRALGDAIEVDVRRASAIGWQGVTSAAGSAQYTLPDWMDPGRAAVHVTGRSTAAPMNAVYFAAVVDQPTRRLTIWARRISDMSAVNAAFFCTVTEVAPQVMRLPFEPDDTESEATE